MNAVLTFEDHFLSTVTAVVMAPVSMLYALLWLIGQAGKAVEPYIQHIALTLAFVALCMAYPLFPVGLVIVAAFGWVTRPRSPRTGGWDNRQPVGA